MRFTMTYMTTATTTFPTAAVNTVASMERQSLSPESTYENRLQAALEHARRLTQMYGYQSADVAIAWETVEELRTAYSRSALPLVPSCESTFERYCSENPYALECRDYDC